MSSAGNGQLILCGEKEKVYEPVNNVLHVGSQETANVVLNGLKNIALTIAIDNFGRVRTDIINIFIKLYII